MLSGWNGAALLALIAVFAGSGRALAIPADGVPYPYPVTAPTNPVGTGTWTFGEGASPQVSVAYPALDPKLGRIGGVIFGGGTGYSFLSGVVKTGDATNGGRIATATDTITVSGAGFSIANTTNVFFQCLSAPCVDTTNYRNTPVNLSNSPNSVVRVPGYSGNATDFVNDNKSLYDAATVTVGNTTSISSQLGTLTGYSVTGQYTATYNRSIIPWTTGDIVHGTLQPALVQDGRFEVKPVPQLGFTSAQAAHLSQFDNFNYLVRLTGYNPNAFDPIGSAGCVLYPNICSILAETEIGRTIGQFDGRAGGNQNTDANNPVGADNFDLYWDQTLPTIGTPEQRTERYARFNVNAAGKDNGLYFGDSPDLLKAGRSLTFHVDLVGWDIQTQSYTILSQAFDDPTLSFNWEWLQTMDHDGIGIATAGEADPNGNFGVGLFLGYGTDDATPQQTYASYDRASFPGGGGGGGGGGNGGGGGQPPTDVPEVPSLPLLAGGLTVAWLSRRARPSAGVSPAG